VSNDLVAKARRMLADRQPPADAAKSKKELFASARAMSEAKQTLVAAPPPKPRAERVKLMMTCSERGLSYLVIAERRDDERGGYELRFTGHEMVQPGPGSGRLPGRLSGRYRIEAQGWACPVCGNADAVWLCDCERMKGVLHCGGNSRGWYHCACGQVEQREFVKVDAVAVRGVSVAATPEGTQQHGRPPFKQVTHDR
jgi:hypothetical protein